MAQVYIGLGSNLEDPLAQLQQALSELAQLPNTQLLSHSRFYRSRAVGPGEQPDYVNAVALLVTELAPLALLDALQAIELAHHRVRLVRWGPRTLDLDILLIDNQQIDHERLQVPHPYLAERNFVLYPLADISPDLCLPSGVSLSSLLARSSQEDLEPLS